MIYYYSFIKGDKEFLLINVKESSKLDMLGYVSQTTLKKYIFLRF